MVALQTLKSINGDLSKTQSMISTGKAVASAKDNAAVWAISKTMESDVKGFKNISDSLNLGESTVAVARNASETITGLLTDIKGKIVAAQEDNVDRGKIQTDIKALRDQITSVTNAAQFNGLNMVKGKESVDILSSLDRNSAGEVSASKITVDRQDLTQSAAALSGADITTATLTDAGSDAQVSSASADLTFTADVTGLNDGDTTSVTLAGIDVEATWNTGDDAAALAAKLETAFDTAKAANPDELGTLTFTNNGDGTFDIGQTAPSAAVAITAGTGFTAAGSATEIAATGDSIAFGAPAEGNGFEITVGEDKFVYAAKAGDTGDDVAAALAGQISAAGLTGVSVNAEGGTLRIGSTDGSTPALALAQKAESEPAGGLADLANLSVTDKELAGAALTAIEGLINKSIDAAAAFGSAEGRIETQANFISKLTDSLKAGIGSMVDANMEEASARLQALQVQQQLGVQSLSIANQAPQSILSLFR